MRATASQMLARLKNWMPLSMPLATDATATTVSRTITPSCTG